MGIQFKSRLGQKGGGFRRGTEDIFGTILGVDNLQAQQAGAFNQGTLDKLLFGTANSRQDFETKQFDEENFKRALQTLDAGGPRETARALDSRLNRANPANAALASSREQGINFKDQQLIKLRTALEADPSNRETQALLNSLLGGVPQADAALATTRQSQEGRTVGALDNLRDAGAQFNFQGSDIPLIDALNAGLTGAGVKSLATTSPEIQSIDAGTGLTKAKTLTEVFRQNKLGADVERVTLLNQLSDEELDQAMRVNPEKLREAIAEADEAEERVQREMQKMETESQKTLATQALTQLRAARNRLAIAKIAGETGLTAKNFGDLVDDRMKLMLGAVPNNPEFEGQTVQAPQAFTNAQGDTIKKGEFVLASTLPPELLRQMAIRQVQEEAQQTGQPPNNELSNA